jgi:hypothetical protein
LLAVAEEAVVILVAVVVVDCVQPCRQLVEAVRLKQNLRLMLVLR